MALGSGFSNNEEAAILLGTSLGLKNQTLYLYLFTGAVGDGLSDDGSINGGASPVALCTGGSLNACGVAITPAMWTGAQGTDPVTLSMPVTNPVTMQAVGSGFGNLCWWALHKNPPSLPIQTTLQWTGAQANMVCHGPITDGSGFPASIPVGVGESFQIDTTNPLRMQIGDKLTNFQ